MGEFRRHKSIILLISVIVAVLGVVVMLGWLLELPILLSILPGYVTMKFNTALFFVLAGTSLCLTNINENKQKGLQLLSKVLAYTIFIGATVTLIQQPLNHNFGIDQFFIADKASVAGNQPFPGRMSILTAICFVMISLALVGIASENQLRKSIAQILLNVSTLLSFIAIGGYLFNVPTLYKLSFLTSMALHTALACFFLSIAAALVNPSLGVTGLFTGIEIGNIMARKVFLYMSISVLILGYLRHLAQRYELVSAEFGISLFALSFILTSLFVVWIIAGKINLIARQKSTAEGSLLKINQLAAIISSSADGIISKTLDGTILTWNQGAEKILGYTFEEVKNKNIAILFPEELKEEEKMLIKKITNSENVAQYETVRVRKDKTRIHVSITLSPIKDETGKIVAVSKVLRDISKIKHEEEELKAATDRLKLATHNSSIGIWDYDLINNHVVWDDNMFDLYGVKKEDFTGAYEAWRKGVHPDDIERVEGDIQLALSGEKEVDTEFRVVWPDGSIHFSKGKSKVQRDGNGKPLRILGTNWDITGQVLAKRELELSNQRNKIFVAQAPTAIAMFDTNMRYMAASEKWVSDYQLQDTELIGRIHYEVFPEIGAEWKKIHQECLAGAIHKCDEDKFVRADGTVQWLKWEDKPWYTDTNKIGGIIMYTEDITVKKKTEEQLRISEEAFRGNFENAAIGMAMLNEKGKWLKVNKKICEIVGYTEEELLQLTFQEITHTDDLDTDLTLLQELIEGKRDHYQMEKRYFHKDGHTVPIILAASIVRNLDGGILYFISQIIDISELKKAEYELAESLQHNQAILDASTQVAIISTNTYGIITSFNRGAENLLGYTAEEMINKKTPELIHVEEELVKRGKELSDILNREISGFDVFTVLIQEGKADSREWTYVRKNGTCFPVQLVATPIKVAHKITGYLGIATDISTIKEAEKEIQALLDVTQDQNSRLKNFAHIVSHNLRSHSGNIDSLIDLLMMENPELKETEIVRYIKQASTNLRETIAHLNEVTLINHSVKDNIQVLNLYDYVEKAIANIRVQAIAAKVELINEIQPGDTVMALPAYLESILLNFFTNGIKYRSYERSSFIKITTYLKHEYRVIKFEDNGMGIDLKMHGAKLFGMYKTFHQNADSRGIGLFITKNQIEALGGKIEVQSEVNKGTVFKIYLGYGKN